MKQFLFACMCGSAAMATSNAIFATSMAAQFGWGHSAMGWGMAAYLIYRREFETES